MKLKLFFFLFFITSSCVVGQVKYEKEYRIEASAVPEKAMVLLKTLALTKKIKWYKEIGHHRKSIEAKSKQFRKKISIEFTPSGNLEDIEVTVPWKTIPKKTRDSISTYFKTTYSKFKIQKVQLQFKTVADYKAFTNKESIDTYTMSYEIVLEAKTNTSYKNYEYGFSEKGTIQSKTEIIPSNTDHLEF